MFFPCNEILDSLQWTMTISSDFPEHIETFKKFDAIVLSKFREYHLPTITLSEDVEKEAICKIFERVNEGGVPLTAFDLLTATFAMEDFNLRLDWYGDSSQGKEGREKRIKSNKLLKSVKETDFLQAVSLISTFNKKYTVQESEKPTEM